MLVSTVPSDLNEKRVFDTLVPRQSAAFDSYRSRVGDPVALRGGTVRCTMIVNTIKISHMPAKKRYDPCNRMFHDLRTQTLDADGVFVSIE